MLRYAARRSCSSITKACSSNWGVQESKDLGQIQDCTSANQCHSGSYSCPRACHPPPQPQQAPGESQSRPSHTPSIPERDLGSTSISLKLSGAGTAPSPLPGTSPDWPAWSHHPPEPLSAPPLPALPLGQCHEYLTKHPAASCSAAKCFLAPSSLQGLCCATAKDSPALDL